MPDASTPGLPYAVEGPRVGLRPFRYEDADEFTARVRESEDLHRPWLFPPATPAAYTAYARSLVEDPARRGYLVCERDGGGIAGFVNVNNIVRGSFQCGALGYGAFAHAAGRGLTGEALALVVRHAFGPLGLHRLEANVQPGNERSLALVRRAGFRREGYSPAMLRVDGAWRDHERRAITAEMPLPTTGPRETADPPGPDRTVARPGGRAHGPVRPPRRDGPGRYPAGGAER